MMGWRAAGGAGRTWPIVAVTCLAVLVATAAPLWLMSAAMKNERLAVRQKLVDVYTERFTEAAQSIERYWDEKDKALSAAGGLPPAEAFAKLVRSGAADSVVIYGSAGHTTYPAAGAAATETPLPVDWGDALDLEYELRLPAEAAAAFDRIAVESSDAATRARALQAKARCLIEAGREGEALAVLTGPLAESALADAADAHGAHIAPNAALLAAELTAKTDEAAGAVLAARLAERLNDYSGEAMPPAQRRFLMQAVAALAPKTDFPTLEAEEIAARYVELLEPVAPTRGALEAARTDPNLWRFTSSDGRVAALFHFATLTRLMESAAGSGAWKKGPAVEIVKLSPAVYESKPFVSVPAGKRAPQWRFDVWLGEDPFEQAARKQVAVYLWMGLLGAGFIAAVAFAGAGHLSRQMRLTRLKNDLIATVSHELKTPLSSMRVLVDTLLDERVTSEAQAREYFQLLAKENERLSRLVENFLTFSRMERGKRAFEREPVSLGDVVSTAVESVRERFERPGSRLTVDVAEKLPSVIGDRDGLITVLVNLLDNAYKYSGEEKTVSVRAYAEERRAGETRACVSVKDDGIGIARRDRKRIFDRFYQVDRSLSRTAGGCGLGLAIVKFIVAAHGGTVDVMSEPGKGSEFIVTLPGETQHGAGRAGLRIEG